MMRVRVAEDQITRLRETAAAWGVPGAAAMRSIPAIKEAIVRAYLREVEAEERRVMHQRHINLLRESAR